jgi:hypothetical protein
MKDPYALLELVLAKLREQLERTEHLLGLVLPERLDWRPEFPASSRTSHPHVSTNR